MIDVGAMIGRSTFEHERAPVSQASINERKFLHSLVKEEYSGEGEIVELGVGGGGTAVPICLGLRENPKVLDKAGRVHLFDWYQLGAGKFGSKVFFRPGKNPKPGDSFEPDVIANLADFSDLYQIHNGDIAEVKFDIARIEILHVDVAKTLPTFQAVFRRFFSRLIPGKSYVLHQDFASPSLSWIHYSTAALLPYIKIFSKPIRSTLPFMLDKEIPPDLFRRISEDDFTVPEKIALIQKMKSTVSVDRSGTLPFEAVLDMSCGFVYHRAGMFEEARFWADKSAETDYIREQRMEHLVKLREEA